jgi:hypothetical protein
VNGEEQRRKNNIKNRVSMQEVQRTGVVRKRKKPTKGGEKEETKTEKQEKRETPRFEKLSQDHTA